MAHLEAEVVPDILHAPGLSLAYRLRPQDSTGLPPLDINKALILHGLDGFVSKAFAKQFPTAL